MAATQRIQNRRIQKYHDKAKSFLIWNGVYRLLNEPYVVFVVSCMTQTLAMSWKSPGEIVNNILMLAMFAVIVGFPVWIFFYIRKNKDNLKN